MRGNISPMPRDTVVRCLTFDMLNKLFSIRQNVHVKAKGRWKKLSNVNRIPRGVWCGSEEVDAGQAGVSWQDRHHAASGAKTPGIHADATGFVPQYRHHDLCCH